jgi:hypothetical protein
MLQAARKLLFVFERCCAGWWMCAFLLKNQQLPSTVLFRELTNAATDHVSHALCFKCKPGLLKFDRASIADLASAGLHDSEIAPNFVAALLQSCSVEVEGIQLSGERRWRNPSLAYLKAR